MTFQRIQIPTKHNKTKSELTYVQSLHALQKKPFFLDNIILQLQPQMNPSKANLTILNPVNSSYSIKIHL